MQIICSNCKKSYTIDPTKIPATVRTAKCKACGYSIPLRQPVAEEPPETTNGRKIKCLYCNRSYSIDPNKIPPNVSTVKCKACGHAISLKQANSETTDSESGSSKITCLYCSKTYTIDRNKIPEGITTTKCKSCNHAISLKPKQSDILPPKPEIKGTGAYLKPAKVVRLAQPVPSMEEPSAAPLWKKPWLIAAVFALIVVGVTSLYTGKDFTKLFGARFAKEPVTKPGIQFQATNLPRPFLSLTIKVPLALESLDQLLPADKKNLNYATTISVINSLKLSRLQIYLFPDTIHTVLPVIVAQNSNSKNLEMTLKKAVAIQTMLERTPDGTYRLKKEAIPADKQNEFPIDLYRVQFVDDGAIIAPKSLLPDLKNTEILQQTQVAQIAASVENPKDLAVLAVRIPENFQTGWEKKIHAVSALKENPQFTMMAAMGVGVLAQMTQTFEDIEALALGFRFEGDSGRTLSYAQQFRKGVDGAKVYQQLNSGEADDFDVDGIVLNLIELIQDPRYQQQIQFANNRLALEFSWSEKDDKAFITALSEATIGQLIAQGMQLAPSAGPIEAKYTDAPELAASVNVKKLQQSIPKVLSQNLFPGHYFESGDAPQMTLNLDTVDIPNASLAELTYRVMAVQTSEGKDVMRRVEEEFKHKLRPGSSFPGHITLNIQKGTPAKALGSAKIRFNLFLPSILEQFEFKANETIGSLKKSNGVDVKLVRLEKDIAKVDYRGGKDIHLIAYDKTGRALASRESMSSASSISTRFQGVIAKLKVVVVRERFDYPFEIDVDLNQGKELELANTPEVPARIRFDHSAIANYVPFTKEDLDDLVVQWKAGGEMSWNDSLSIQLPKGPFSGKVDWEVHFFGKDRPLYLAGNAVSGSKDVNFSLQKDELQKAHAAFGSVQLNFASQIHRLRFVKKSDGKPVVHRLPSGKDVVVIFNKNEITLNTATAEMIQAMAFDADNRRLKKDNHTRHKDGKLIQYFWGVPATFEMDLVTNTVHKIIHFDIKQRPLNAEAYLKFQIDVENQGEVVKTLQAISRARNKDRSGYGDDLAGLYYIYDHKKKKPKKLIEKNVAHADPAGQKRFGYTAKPYKDYYFTILSGMETDGTQKAYPKQSKKRTYAWHQGTFQTTPFVQVPDIVAIPVDPSQPAFFLQWGRVYMKQLNGSKFEYLPQDYDSQGWIEAKFIES